MERKRKGQAALEFLMTYGWAILAAIIVIGVLGYFFLSSDKLTPSSAVISQPFYAKAWKADATAGTVVLDVINQGGESVTISGDPTIEITGTANLCTYTIAAGDEVWPAGEQRQATFDCSGTIAAGDSVRGDIEIKYTKSGSTLVLSAPGSISTKAQ